MIIVISFCFLATIKIRENEKNKLQYRNCLDPDSI